MGTVRIEREGPLVVLRLDKQRANAIDLQLLDDLLAACSELSADDGVSGVLLASAHPRVFCPGLDLVSLIELQRDELRAFMRRFSEAIWALYGFYKPMVAALAGHAVAGGCVLALTADLRILRPEGVQVGLNEVRVGVPLPWSVALLLRATLPAQALVRVALDGSNFSGEEAVAMGLATERGPVSDFESHCLSRLGDLASRHPRAYALTKSYLREDVLERMKIEEGQHLPDFLDCWFSDESQSRIRAQVAALTKPRES